MKKKVRKRQTVICKECQLKDRQITELYNIINCYRALYIQERDKQ